MTERSDNLSDARRRKFNTAERSALWYAHKQRCAYTGEPVKFPELQIDHIIPISSNDDYLTRLRSLGIIDSNFQFNSFENLLPTGIWRNNQKSSTCLDPSNVAYFLSIAKTRAPIAQRILDDTKREESTLRSYLALKIAAENQSVTLDELIELKAHQAEGLVPIRHFVGIEGAEDILRMNAALADELMARPFALGGGSITSVKLQTDDDKITVCRNCQEYLTALRNGLWPLTQFDITCSVMADIACLTLESISIATFAPVSLIRSPRVGLRDLEYWSSDWAIMMGAGEEREFEQLTSRHGTLAAIINHEGYTAEYASDTDVIILPPGGGGIGMRLVELLRADLDADGEEEILVACTGFATGGTLRFGGVYRGKPRPDPLIISRIS